MGLLIPLFLIALCCLVIWRAGDGFMVASEYVGRNLSEGVRGATINAIASSMPEVFTSFFFLLIGHAPFYDCAVLFFDLAEDCPRHHPNICIQ